MQDNEATKMCEGKVAREKSRPRLHAYSYSTVYGVSHALKCFESGYCESIEISTRIFLSLVTREARSSEGGDPNCASSFSVYHTLDLNICRIKLCLSGQDRLSSPQGFSRRAKKSVCKSAKAPLPARSGANLTLLRRPIQTLISMARTSSYHPSKTLCRRILTTDVCISLPSPPSAAFQVLKDDKSRAIKPGGARHL